LLASSLNVHEPPRDFLGSTILLQRTTGPCDVVVVTRKRVIAEPPDDLIVHVTLRVLTPGTIDAMVVRAKRDGDAADEVGSAMSAVPKQRSKAMAEVVRRIRCTRGPVSPWPPLRTNTLNRRTLMVPDIGASFQRTVLCGVAFFLRRQPIRS
jgi:hypothetical protein